MNLTGRAEPERLAAMRATSAYFRVLGTTALLGRTFLPGEDQPGRDRVAVISAGLWQRLFGGRADVLRSTLQLNGEPYQVVGVMPPSFRDFYMREADLWAPLAFTPEQFADDKRTNEFLRMIGRLKAGATVEGAAREMTALGEQLKKDYPTQYPPDWTLKTRALAEEGRQTIRPALLVLLGAVALVLLIACANIANLLLARAAARARELAIRTALGATRATLVVQMLAESVVLSIAGGALGLLLAYGALRALDRAQPFEHPTHRRHPDRHRRARVHQPRVGRHRPRVRHSARAARRAGGRPVWTARGWPIERRRWRRHWSAAVSSSQRLRSPSCCSSPRAC